MMSTLEQLAQYTTLVADTGDIQQIERLKPVDATTNPSLLLKSAFDPKYRTIIKEAREHANRLGGSEAAILANWCDLIAVGFGKKILEQIPGRVSTEVDARLSFNTQATVAKARRLIHFYQDAGISRDRVLIKIASTWEGIQAARILEQEEIQCNLTLLFSLEQAIAAAEAGAFLISPFVGRILDWHKAHHPEVSYTPENDPGVLSVKSIYHYFKYFGYNTIVMGASFRNSAEVQALAGCDRLTISPALLDELAQSNQPIKRALSPSNLPSELDKIALDESAFRWALNENTMANEKLADGIRRFTADQRTLEKTLSTTNI